MRLIFILFLCFASYLMSLVTFGGQDHVINVLMSSNLALSWDKAVLLFLVISICEALYMYQIRQEERGAYSEQFAEGERLLVKKHAEQEELFEKFTEEIAKREELERLLADANSTLRQLREELKHFHDPAFRSAQIDAELLNLLNHFQKKGRLIDFLMEDIAQFSNEQVGHVARIVHEGCSKFLREHFSPQPILLEAEGEQIIVGGKYTPQQLRYIGSVPETTEFAGKIVHRGWQAGKITIARVVRNPQESDAMLVMSPAEVEVSGY